MATRQQNLPSGNTNDAQFGNWVGAYSPVPVRGTIISVNPVSGSCVVKSEFGNFLSNVALPNSTQDPDGGGGTLDIPRRGQDVFVQFGVSHPFIVQFCPVSADLDKDTPPAFSLTEVGLADVLDGGDAANFAGRLPVDGQPGDWAKIGNQGQRLGVLDGGVCVIGSSPWAQIYTIASPEKDITRIVGRHTQLYSQFGTLEFGEDGGKTWLKLEGGTDQLTESTISPANPTFRALVGGASAGMMSLQTFDREGAPVYEHIVDYDGSVNFHSRGNQTLISEGSLIHDIQLGRTTRVLTENDNLSVLNGDRVEKYQGAQKTSVSGRKALNVGQDYAATVQRDIAFTAGRHIRFSAGGDLKAKPGDVASQWNVTNGTLYFEIGNPASLDTQAARSGFKVLSMGGGDIMLGALRPPSRIILGSMFPDSVVLGGDPMTGAAAFHAVKWETLVPILKTLALAIDSHIHIGMGSPTTPNTVPITPTAETMFQLCRSINVMLGG
ncbi:MAG: hypothetical protein DRJ03_01735 [Chloroflexi bacterium]|nr:MAG: hypothetical protein DRJ03_01735 [Chloroflexota bacterium]